MQCPECKGKGCYHSQRFVNSTSGCRYEEGERECGTCKGTGSITDDHAERIKQGEARRRDRISRDMSLREEAKRLGIKPSELSDIERGRV
jgi:ribosome-binding protein aMBF1 (putative translation factor)